MPDDNNDPAPLRALFQAADEHAANSGEEDMTVGDLQEMLRAAYRLLTPHQRDDFFDSVELQDLAGLPEYDFLADQRTKPD